MSTEMNKKFCSKCGTELDLAAAFCPGCGEKCDAPAADASAPIPTPIQQYNMNIAPKKAKIDLKKTIGNNKIAVAFLVIGIIMIALGMSMSIPSGYISSYAMTEYVGGDAYNFIIEACIRGGEIAGAQISRCVYICVGILVACVSALKINVVKPDDENN